MDTLLTSWFISVSFPSFKIFIGLLELLYLSPRYVALLLLVKIKSVICVSAAHNLLVNVGHSIAWCPSWQIQMDKKCPVRYGTWGFITLITKPLYIEPAESISPPQITTYSRSSHLFVCLPSRPRHSSDLQNKILKEFLNHVPSRSVTLISAPWTSYEFKSLRSPMHNFLELTDNFPRLKCKHYPQHSAAVGKTSAATLVKNRPIFLSDCALATHSIYWLLI
jgi:hypothetical protein